MDFLSTPFCTYVWSNSLFPPPAWVLNCDGNRCPRQVRVESRIQDPQNATPNPSYRRNRPGSTSRAIAVPPASCSVCIVSSQMQLLRTKDSSETGSAFWRGPATCLRPTGENPLGLALRMARLKNPQWRRVGLGGGDRVLLDLGCTKWIRVKIIISWTQLHCNCSMRNTMLNAPDRNRGTNGSKYGASSSFSISELGSRRTDGEVFDPCTLSLSISIGLKVLKIGYRLNLESIIIVILYYRP